MELIKKLFGRGLGSLTNKELLAILLGGGAKEERAEMLSRNYDLRELAKMGPHDLGLKGLSPGQKAKILVAFELGRRKHLVQNQKIKVTSAETVANYISPILGDLDQEVFYVLFLNRNNVIKSETQFFKGGVASTIIDPKIVFREAVNRLATAIILVHNHPSGNLRPSQADKESTSKLIAAGKLFDILVLDHVIVSSEGYFSFLDNDIMY